jgi:hypothetical protein
VLTPLQQADLLTIGINGSSLSEIAGYITERRESILDSEGAIPSYVVFTDAFGDTRVAGLRTYLQNTNANQFLIERIEFHQQVCAAICSLRGSYRLESLGAAILQGLTNHGEVTRGSSDQGIDFLGSLPLIPLNPAFVNGDVRQAAVLPGESSFIMGSSKGLKRNRANRPTLNPAYIRELVGGWLIQRSEVRLWRELGVKMLSPLQMILLTTYRLSADARRLCHTLGVQVWNLPELVSLVCLTAPAPVFKYGQTSRLVLTRFNNWVDSKSSVAPVAAIAPAAAGPPDVAIAPAAV